MFATRWCLASAAADLACAAAAVCSLGGRESLAAALPRCVRVAAFNLVADSLVLDLLAKLLELFRFALLGLLVDLAVAIIFACLPIFESFSAAGVKLCLVCDGIAVCTRDAFFDFAEGTFLVGQALCLVLEVFTFERACLCVALLLLR